MDIDFKLKYGLFRIPIASSSSKYTYNMIEPHLKFNDKDILQKSGVFVFTDIVSNASNYKAFANERILAMKREYGID